MRVPSLVLLLLAAGAALGQMLDATTPVVQLVAPSDGAASCAALSVSWLTHLPENSSAAAVLFALELVPVESGDPTSSVSVPTSTHLKPGRRRQVLAPRHTVTLHKGLGVMQGAFTEPALAASPGWYVLNGTRPTPADTGVVFLASQPFMVRDGDSTMCLTSTSPPPASTSAAPTPGRSDAASTRRAEVIAGSVIGAVAVAALALMLLWRLCRGRRRQTRGGSDDTASVSAWRATRAAQWLSFGSSGTPSERHTEDSEKGEQTEEERAALAVKLAQMLRQAGIQEGLGGQRNRALRPEHFGMPGVTAAVA